ncbi:MAG: hypothetical protein RLQ73_00690 [Hoeflea sp. D1-CHI-28]
MACSHNTLRRALLKGLPPAYRLVATIAARFQFNLNYLFDPRTAWSRGEPLRLSQPSRKVRREVLKLLPVFPLGALGIGAPTAVEANITTFGVSPKIWAKFHEWMEFRHQVHVATRQPGAVEEHLDALDDQLIEMERCILAIPSASPADTMIKVLVYTSFGGFEVSKTLLDEAVEACGLSDDPRAEW